MLNRFVGAALVAAALGSAAYAQEAPRYAPANIFGSGYADEQVEPGVWTVRGASATPDGGHAIALYRAAELAQQAGASEMRIVHQKIITTRDGRSYSFEREVAHLKVRAIRDPADRTACEEKVATHCITVSVARMLAQFGPQLNQSAGPHPELAARGPAVRLGSSVVPPGLIQAFNARQAALGRPVMPVANSVPVAQPVVMPDRPLSAYEQGRLAGAAARAAQQSDD